MRPTAFLGLLCCTVIVSVAAPASAQITEVATFNVGGQSSFVPGVAVGTDGSIVFSWSETIDGERRASVRRFDGAGLPIGLPVEVDPMLEVRDTAIGVRPDGTFMATWHRRADGSSSLFARRLDATGTPVGTTFRVSSNDDSYDGIGVTGLSTGSIFSWRRGAFSARLYDATGTPAGGEFIVAASNVTGDVAVLPDGGYVMVWETGARLFDADGTPRGPAISLGAAFKPRRVGVSANGDIVAVGIGAGSGPNPNGVWMRRLDATGALIGTPVLVHQGYPEQFWVPDVDLDAQGNVLVVWGGKDDGDVSTQKVRGRAFDASNAPLGHEFVVANEFASGVRVARLADDRFVVVWNGSQNGTAAKILSLCLPTVTQCGDGVLHADCELCDDGAANSDTAPDACRTDCSLPRCSDGAVDTGEQCDDGNLTMCDGCSTLCVSEPGLVCGDGLPEPSCEQPCDDANATSGDGCTSQCTLEPIAGGGSRSTDCRAVWVVDNPSNDPLTDKHGAFRAIHRCIDDDPTCDFDGGTPGGCTFHVRVCANGSGFPDCKSGVRIAAWALDKPSEKQATKDAALAAVRASFATVPGAVVGPSSPDVCTEWLAVRIPMRGSAGDYRAGKINLKSRATLYDGAEDKDKLKLECRPAE